VAWLDRLDSDWRSAGRTWLGAVGVLLVASTLGLTTGPIGVVAGVIVAVLWSILPGPYAVAGGHLVVLPLLPAEPTISTLIAFEAGMVALLAAPLVRERRWPRPAAMFAVLAVVLGGLAWGAWGGWRPRWLVLIALAGLVAGGLFTVHRYVVVVLEDRGAVLHA
jgi:hypothetical protein